MFEKKLLTECSNPVSPDKVFLLLIKILLSLIFSDFFYIFFIFLLAVARTYTLLKCNLNLICQTYSEPCQMSAMEDSLHLSQVQSELNLSDVFRTLSNICDGRL